MSRLLIAAGVAIALAVAPSTTIATGPPVKDCPSSSDPSGETSGFVCTDRVKVREEIQVPVRADAATVRVVLRRVDHRARRLVVAVETSETCAARAHGVGLRLVVRCSASGVRAKVVNRRHRPRPAILVTTSRI